MCSLDVKPICIWIPETIGNFNDVYSRNAWVSCFLCPYGLIIRITPIVMHILSSKSFFNFYEPLLEWKCNYSLLNMCIYNSFLYQHLVLRISHTIIDPILWDQPCVMGFIKVWRYFYPIPQNNTMFF